MAIASIGALAILGASLAGPAVAPVIGPFVPIVVATTLGAALLAVPRRGR